MTRFLVDAAYLSAALVTSPVWIYRMAKSGKLRTDWRARFGRVTTPRPRGKRPRLLIHAVSVGEVNAIRLLVEALAADPLRPEIVVAATTDTGFARAQALFAQGASGPSATGAASVQVVRYPFDASWAVSRFLDAVKPDLVALVELEVWPNFTAACATRGIPCVVVNGRLSERSFRRYRIARPIVSPSFQRLLAVSAQSDAYAERFTALGVARGSVFVGGTMKWDTAEIADRVAGAEDLARELGIDRTRPLVVAGSTAPGEETIIANALPAEVQLLIAPRKPEWFDGVAAALDGVARRSRGERGSPTGRFLLDTIGELRKAYALADLVIVGRSFGNLHGSDMMEPIALGKATLIGPRSGDFRDMMDALREGQGIVETTAERLGEDIRRLLGDSDARAALAARGRAVIRARQGATRRNAELLLSMLPSPRVDASMPAPAPTEPSSASHA